MYRCFLFFLMLVTGLLVSCQSGGPEVEAPVAKIVPKRFEIHGDVRVDNYYWLRERENPEVVAYLEAENRYTDAMMAHTKGLQETLFEEFKDRIQQTDVTVPYRKGGYYFYSRTEEGKQYPIYCRKKDSLDGNEEVILDNNALAEGRTYCFLFQTKESPDNKLLAYSVDYVGRRLFEIHFKNIETGEELRDVIPQVTGMMEWADDSQTLFYVKQNPQTLRWHQVWRHEVGTDASKDVLVFDERDERFFTLLRKSRSGKYLIVSSIHTLSTEVRYLDADRPRDEFRVFLPREEGHLYHLAHAGDHFYIRTNDNAENFRLMKTPVGRTGRENWLEVIPHREDVLVEALDVFRNDLVVYERKAGLLQFRIVPLAGGEEHYIDFAEPAYNATPTSNEEFDTNVVRFSYSSLTTPESIFDYDMNKRQRKLLKQDEMGGGFDRSNYKTERIFAAARDGARVPVSLVYRQDVFGRNGANPLLLHGYGSYGISSDASFDPYRVSLLDRGFVYAIAHVRGGQEMGRQWYEDGKLLEKMNTFTDFIDCAEHLIREKYADPKRVFASGASAGGLLIGAVVNLRPDLWRGAIAGVPFVDVVNTMLDDSVPTVTAEYDEWGDPNKKEYYEYMLSYSPYDNVAPKDYPNMLVTAAFEDSQVQYWEPAKWVAKLRAMKTGYNIILLSTGMEGSHGGASERYDRYRSEAFRCAFLLDLASIRK